MSDMLSIKFSWDLARELNALYGLNLIRELKAIGDEMVLHQNKKGYQIEIARKEEDSWVIEEVLSPDRIKEVENQIDAITPEERQKTLMECLPKIMKESKVDHGNV